METTPVIEFPLSGRWLALSPPGHARWAFDLLAYGPDSTCLASGSWRSVVGRLNAENVHSWGKTVRAPLGGEVVAAHDREPDRGHVSLLRDLSATFLLRPLRHGRNLAAMAGNHLVIGSPDGSVLLAHLRLGSLRVQPGETVTAGEVVGEVGNSGNTVGPHLHLQVMSGTEATSAPVVPFLIRGYDLWDGHTWQTRTKAPLQTRSRIRAQPRSS